MFRLATPPNAMNPFSKLANGEKVMKNRYKFLIPFAKIVRRHANFCARYSFRPAQNGKIFQHRLIYFIRTNAMNSFSKLTNGKSYENLLSWPIGRQRHTSDILMICWNTIGLIHHPLHKDSVSAHSASHHTWAPYLPPSKFRAAFVTSNLFEIQWKEWFFLYCQKRRDVSSKVCISDILTPITTLLVVLTRAVESASWKGLRFWSFSCSWWDNFYISHPTPSRFRS